MACPEVSMNQQRRFIEAMSNAARIELAYEGRVLIVFDDDGEQVLELSRIIEK